MFANVINKNVVMDGSEDVFEKNNMITVNRL